MADNKEEITLSDGFSVKRDMYNGYTIDTKFQKQEDLRKHFEEHLPAALKKWREDRIKGVWVKARSAGSEVVPVCTKLGFDFHHAKPGYVMLVIWLPEKIESRIPGYADHYLGVAGFVVNDKGQLLVIQERYNHPLLQKHWKLPGGLSDPGESLEETAKREVLEETGIQAEFISVIAFRHTHGFRYGCADWYFICLMKPVTEEIKKCPHEIADCRWMDIDEYLADPNITDTNSFIAQCYKDGMMKHENLQILPTDVLNFSKKHYQRIYSVQLKTQDDMRDSIPKYHKSQTEEQSKETE